MKQQSLSHLACLLNVIYILKMTYVSSTPSTDIGEAKAIIDRIVISKIGICSEFYRLGCLVSAARILVNY